MILKFTLNHQNFEWNLAHCACETNEGKGQLHASLSDPPVCHWKKNTWIYLTDKSEPSRAELTVPHRCVRQQPGQQAPCPGCVSGAARCVGALCLAWLPGWQRYHGSVLFQPGWTEGLPVSFSLSLSSGTNASCYFWLQRSLDGFSCGSHLLLAGKTH